MASDPAPDPAPPLAVCVVVAAGDRYLFVRRAPGRPAPGYWTPVTGKLEPGETLAEAAVREVREETGLDVSILPGELQRTLTADGGYLLVWFRAVPRGGQGPLILAPDEVSEARWVTAAEILELSPLFSATRDFFASEGDHAVAHPAPTHA